MQSKSDEQLLEEIQKRLVDNRKLLQKQQEALKQMQVLNRKLDESEAMKSHFLSNIRNEILNPFTAIITISQGLSQAKSLDLDKVKTMARLIYKEAFNMDYQLKNIFEAAAIEAGEFILERAEINFNCLLNEIVNYFHLATEEKKVKLVIRLSDELKEGKSFISDPEKIKTILINLISNAIKYSNEGQKILISLQYQERNLLITIKDSGLGFDKDLERELFDRFSQLKSENSQLSSGHGLGLSIVKHIVDSMEGSIKITSKPNHGATFKITIPEFDSNDAITAFFPDGIQFFISPETKF